MALNGTTGDPAPIGTVGDAKPLEVPPICSGVAICPYNIRDCGEVGTTLQDENQVPNECRVALVALIQHIFLASTRVIAEKPEGLLKR